MNQKIKVLGTEFSNFTIESIIDFVKDCVDQNTNRVLANHNLHSIYLYHTNHAFREFIDNQEYIHADGMPLIFWAKILGYDVSRKNRITYLDLIYPLLEQANKNSYRFFYVGGKPGVAEKASEILNDRYKEVTFGSSHGYFDINDQEFNDELIKKINAFQPDILMVGMGMPRQEHWIGKYYNQLDAHVIMPVGAIFDYISGETATPPRWMGKVGLEWFYRLVSEPRRLFGRYIVEPLYLIPFFIKDVFNKRPLT